MKRLRNPIRAIREPFGTAGLIVAMIALVAALGGTALAAAKLNSTQKKEVEKIAKKYAGKPGTSGANGTNGTNGAPGAKGDAGSAGAAGVSGESVTITPEGECTKFSNKSGSGKACNGTTGFTEFLPSGSTETGTYNVRSTDKATGETRTVAISFPIPLEVAPESTQFSAVGETNEGCTGTVEAPTAEAGHLCIYEGEAGFGVHQGGLNFVLPLNPAGAAGPGTTGAELAFSTIEKGQPPVPITPGEEISAEGTWAVTAK
jgi:hypothetical protein